MRSRRRLSQQDLKAAGITPGLMARRYDAAGRGRLMQLAPERTARRRDFVHRLTDDTKAGERG